MTKPWRLQAEPENWFTYQLSPSPLELWETSAKCIQASILPNLLLSELEKKGKKEENGLVDIV